MLNLLTLFGLIAVADACWLLGWSDWSECSESCGGRGTKRRFREHECVGTDSLHQVYNDQFQCCNTECLNGGTLNLGPGGTSIHNGSGYCIGSCDCPSGYSGTCCQSQNTTTRVLSQLNTAKRRRLARSLTLLLLIGFIGDGGWSDWSSWSTACSTRCGPGTLNRTRTCTKPRPDSGGRDCSGDDTEDNPCQSLCCWDDHWCWPGQCGANNFTSDCSCDAGFKKVETDTSTKCQLSKLPSIHTCQVKLKDSHGDDAPTIGDPCDDEKAVYTKLQPCNVSYTLVASFKVEVTSIQPARVESYLFGIVSSEVALVKTDAGGTDSRLNKNNLNTKQECTLGENDDDIDDWHPKDFVSCTSNSITSETLHNGDRLCVKFTTFAGGFIETKPFTTSQTSKKDKYERTRSDRSVCFMFDDFPPEHCFILGTCHYEPLTLNARITSASRVQAKFPGWTDPPPTGGSTDQASGIKSITASILRVTEFGLNDLKMNYSTSESTNASWSFQDVTFILSVEPALYAVLLEVHDVAGNVRMARRFVLYDKSSTVSIFPKTTLLSTTASSLANYTWQIHHGRTCLNWTGRYHNTYHSHYNLLRPIRPDGNISSTYDQTKGFLPVSGTQNVNGIVKFSYTLKLNDQVYQSYKTIPDVHSESFCEDLHPSDGQRYTFQVKPIDVNGRFLTEEYVVNIDRSAPEVENVWLMKDGYRQLFVHNSTDLAKMTLQFEAFDSHSGLYSLGWRLGTTNGASDIGTGHLKVNRIDGSCSQQSCYCPSIGQCENFKYAIDLNGLVANNTHKGQHNRAYFFTIIPTNNARLYNTEHLEVLADDSPPEEGVIQEGAIGTPDIDFTSENDIIVSWSGFIDHESGIYLYRVGVASDCLTDEDFNSNGTKLNSATVQETKRQSAKFALNSDGYFRSSVIAFNNAMEPSKIVCSDGFHRDSTHPVVRNVTLKHSKSIESIACASDGPWLVQSNLSKKALPNTNICTERCTTAQAIALLEHLPVTEAQNNDPDTAENLCRTLPSVTDDWYIYIPSNKIDISWNSQDAESQIRSEEIGFASGPSMVSSPDLEAYRNSHGHSRYHSNHEGIDAGFPFYIFIRVTNKANMVSVVTLGPVVIDDTPPMYTGGLHVKVEQADNKIYCSWRSDTFKDTEQKHAIDSVLFRIGSAGQFCTTLVQVPPGQKCPRSEMYSCVQYPLHELQRQDEEKGLLFYFELYVYNMADHFVTVRSDPFTLPSRFVPGHGTVLDIDPTTLPANGPEGIEVDELQDANVHFVSEKVCVAWSGFYHHQNVSFQVGVGSHSNTDDIIHFESVSETTTIYCFNSPTLTPFVKYFVLVKATCSAGSVIVSSDGITIVDPQLVHDDLDVSVGVSCEYVPPVKLQAHIGEDLNSFSYEPQDRLDIGHAYTLELRSSSNLDVQSNDVLWLAHKSINGIQYKREFRLLKEYPSFAVLEGGFELNTSLDIFVRKCANQISSVSSSETVSAFWVVPKSIEGLAEEFHAYLLQNNCPSSVNVVKNKTCLSVVAGPLSANREHNVTFRQLSLVNTRSYVVGVDVCFGIACLPRVDSNLVFVQYLPPVTAGFTASIIDIKDGCVDVDLQWKPFDCISPDSTATVAMYEWSLALGESSEGRLTAWSPASQHITRLQGSSQNSVMECVAVDVYPHRPLYACLKVMCISGTMATVCSRMETPHPNDYVETHLYEIDANLPEIETIKTQFHARYLGDTLRRLHDLDLNYCRKNTTILGVIPNTAERNITWYLMLTQRIPASRMCEDDTMCVMSATTTGGFEEFHKAQYRPGTKYFLCAWSNSTIIRRELFDETLGEIQLCGNGFLVDDAPPTPGVVTVINQRHGFLLESTELALSWEGFSDSASSESIDFHTNSSIQTYSVAIGAAPGGTDVMSYKAVGRTKFVHLTGLNLTNGVRYYATIRATDFVGLSAEAISKAVTMDTTPPETGIVTVGGTLRHRSLLSTKHLTVHWSGFKDEESGIDKVLIGIGSRPDVDNVRAFTESQTQLADLSLDRFQDGRKYFAVIKVSNKAGLWSLTSSPPFVLDSTPPTGGVVRDGDRSSQADVDFQNYTSSLSCHWDGFYDPHSGIHLYRVGLGTSKGTFDVFDLTGVGLKTDKTWREHLFPGEKYFVTVEACNGAGLCTRRHSDGVVIDDSPPIPGLVHVGISTRHEKYQSHSNFISAQWIGFEDPHSGLNHFEWCVTVDPDKCDIQPFTNTLLSKSVFKSQLHLPINTNICVRLRAYNNVGMVTEAISDSFRVDDTPPFLKEKPRFILDEMQVSHQQGTQWDNSLIKLTWKFSDLDSPITKHVVHLNTHHDGKVLKQISQLGNEDKVTIHMDEQELLKNGDRYSATVTACNAAGLCTHSTSDDLLIDSSPPHLGGFQHPMTWRNIGSRSEVLVTWYGFADVESRINSYFISVGDTYSGSELSGGVVVVKATPGNPEQNTSIVLTRSVKQNQKLILSIWATNDAGLRSNIGRVTVTAMKTDSTGSKGILKLEKHSCDSHFCNNDCTCAVVGKTCETLPYVLECTEVSENATNAVRFPDVTVVGGMLDAHQSLTASASCLSGHWVSDEDNSSRPIVRYEWSMGITNDVTGDGIFQGPFERVWHDVGLLLNITYCLPFPRTLLHDQSYTIYVKAWYSESATRIFTSPPIHVDRTPPGIARGKFVFESLDACNSDVEFITSSSSLQICWQRVFRESQSQILKFELMAGSQPYGDDLIPVTDYGLATKATLRDLALYPGTRYYFTVRAINTLGLMASLASDGVVLDAEPPYTGVVFNTNRHRNTHFQSSSSSIGLSWHGFGDHHSHIHHYSVAVTDRETGLVVASDMNVGIKTSIQFFNLPLVQNHTYRGSVKAWNAAGHASEVVHSQSVKVDNTPPISFQCTEFSELYSETNIKSRDVDVQKNLLKDIFYKINVRINDPSLLQSSLQMTIGELMMMLQLTENADGTKETAHAFLSYFNGATSIRISFLYEVESITVGLSRCARMDFDSQDPPVDVMQIGPSLLSVCTRAIDPESGIRSVQVGVGTTRGGFQSHPLAVVPLENHINIEHEACHGSTLHVAVILHNHVGLWSVFNGNEITVDHTPPYIHSVVSSMTLAAVENVTNTRTADITVHGIVEDKESGVKTCQCILDKLIMKSHTDPSSRSETRIECNFSEVSVHHGTTLTTYVRCVNNVGLVSLADGEELTASFLRPSSTSAHVDIIPDNEISEEFNDSLLGGGDGIVTQDNLTTLQARWSGFHDVTGLSHYSYRLLRDNVSVTVGPQMTTGHSMVELHGLTLRDGGVYTVEVEAVNPGGIHSDPVLAQVKVDSRKPVLSDHSVTVQRKGGKIVLDWDGVFQTTMTVIYDVTIGTREGFCDILARFETKATSVTVPDRSDVSSVWVAVRAVYLTGRDTFYRETIIL